MKNGQELNEKKFAENLLELLMASTVVKGERPEQRFVDFFKKTVPRVSRFYTYYFHDISDWKKSIVFYSDTRFKGFEKRHFFSIGNNLHGLKTEFSLMIEDIRRIGNGYYFIEDSIEDSAFGEFSAKVKKNYVATQNIKKLKDLKFNLFTKELKRVGFEKKLCENVEDALNEIYHFSNSYTENYFSFLKAKSIPVLHEKFRELSYAKTCLIACTSRWYPLLKHITFDKRYMLGFKD